MDQLKKLFSSLTLKQRVSLVVAAIAVIGGLLAASHWNTERDFKSLYGGLSQEDAAAVLAKVREGGTEYRLGEGGTSVMVPSAKVAEMRLNLAAAGVPRSGRIGYELFDKTNLGASDFAEQLNYHRALEGELERSVTSLAAVESARVHITMAKDSVFLESRQPAKASVLVKLKPGSQLTPQNVMAICQLTASAVEGLAPETVSVVDMRGNLLSRPHKALSPDSPEPNDGALEYKARIERELLAKIGTTLEPLLGAEKFRAGVSVECDFTSGEQSEETFDPGKSVMVSSQKTEDISGGNLASGQPGTASNLPRPAARPGGGSTGVARRTENVAFQSSRLVRRTRLPQGTLRRMSVSILVDNVLHFEGTGPRAKRVLEPPPPARMKAIHDLVAGVVGLSAERGDQLVIESLPFESTMNAEPPVAPSAPAAKPSGLPPWLENSLQNRMLVIGGAAAALVLLLAVAGAVVMMKKKSKKRTQAEIKMQLAAPGGALKQPEQDLSKKLEAQLAEQAAVRERQEAEALINLKLPPVITKKTDVLTKHINEEAKKDPKIMAQILRTWINEGLR